MQFWFTGDSHFNHTNIIKYTNRPFKDVYHMNETIIKNWNERVNDEDTVFHLGDLCFKEKDGVKAQDWIDRLNGNMILIKGNHDNNNSAKTIINSMIIELGGKTWWLEHHPFNSNHKYNLIGHIHNLWKIRKEHNKYYINCGVDVWDFRPVSIEEILKRVSDYDHGRLESEQVLS